MSKRAKRKNRLQIVQNKCGSCTSCCVDLEIAEYDFRKPARDTCPHLAKTSGCSIYKTRPEVCREFRCLWLDDPYAGEEDRPDNCGFLAWFTEPTVLKITETREGSLYSKRYNAIVTSAKALNVLVCVEPLEGEIFSIPKGIISRNGSKITIDIESPNWDRLHQITTELSEGPSLPKP